MTLACEGASVRLGQRQVLSRLSLALQPGELVAVVGPNGAGKSTTLKLLAGLLAPEEGRVTLDGAPLASYARQELGCSIAYLPQDRTVHWGLKCERVVALGRLPHRSFAAGESDKDRHAISAAMVRMDVGELQHRSVASLSGGERARVLVARALAQEATYLIADEPTAGLDPAHTLSLFDELRRLAADGHGVITALHDLSLAARYATRVVLMREGASIAAGPPDEVLSSANLRRAFAIDAIISHIQDIPVVLPRSVTAPTPP